MQIENFIQDLNLIDDMFQYKTIEDRTISADYIKIVYQEILSLLKNKPNPVILETGSGVSTILIAYLLEKYAPEATFISLEHDIDYKLKTERELAMHNLANVHLLYAPLRKYQLGEELWYWYEISPLMEILQDKKIDFLSIDGPPMATQPMARYPVLPLLQDELAQEYILLLNDADREDEKAIVQRWKREFGPFETEHIATEKGTVLLRHKKLAMQPKISICIPTYNRKEYLLQAIESSLAQRYENFEVVVVDDGSTDGTREMMQSIRDDRIRYIRNDENRGRSYTRNRCIEEAKGEYILWLDDDDALTDDILDQYMLLLNSYNDLDVIYGIYREFDNNRIIINPIDFYLNNIDLMNRIFIMGCPIPHGGTIVRKKIYEKYGTYNKEFTRAQDYEFWSRVALYVKFKKYNGICYSYRIYDGNISAVNRDELDTTYESKIIRKIFNEEMIVQAFDYAQNREIVFYEMAEHLHKNFDNCNALYYFQFSSKKMHKKVLIALQADMITYAKKLYHEVNENKETLKQILKQYSFIKKRSLELVQKQNFHSLETYVETLQKILPNSWLMFYLKAYLVMYRGDKKLATKYAKKSLICNPLSDSSLLLLQDLGVESKEIERIRSWLLDPLNEFEINKPAFIESLR